MISGLFVLLACQTQEKESNNQVLSIPEATAEEPIVIDRGPLEFNGLIDVQSLNDQIYCELKYASEDNFMDFSFIKASSVLIYRMLLSVFPNAGLSY